MRGGYLFPFLRTVQMPAIDLKVIYSTCQNTGRCMLHTSSKHPQMPLKSLDNYLTNPQMNKRSFKKSVRGRNGEINRCQAILQ